jgi:hypothetical protein
MTHTIENGATVTTTDNEQYTITGFAAGWYSTEEGKKLRGKQIAGVVAPELEVELEDEPEEDDEPETISQKMRRYRATYEDATTADGKPSKHNGDEVAQLLAGKDLLACYAIASKKLKVPVAELQAKYEHLNPGMQRMNLGNGIRRLLKKA